jgi:hypothetical protein
VDVREGSSVVSDDKVEVPEAFKKIGFSGLFHTEATLADETDLEEFEAKLPARVPFGTNSSWLALRMNRDETPVTVTLVRTDTATIVDLVTKH